MLLPAIKRLFRNACLPDQIRHRHAQFNLLQHGDYLLSLKRVFLMADLLQKVSLPKTRFLSDPKFLNQITRHGRLRVGKSVHD